MSPLLALLTPVESGPAYGIIGLDSITIGSTPALIDSFDSAKGQYGANNKGSAAILISNGAIAIEGSKVYGDVRSDASSVMLKSSSLVNGNVFAGTTILNGGTIKGTASPNSPSALIVPQAIAQCSPFTPAGGIGGKFTYDAAEGDLTITGDNSATLAGGAYCFHNLTLAGGGKLTASGPVTVHLTGQFNASGNSSSSAGGVPSKLQILSSYTGSNGVVLSGTTDLYLTIYAPQTGVRLSGTPQLYGSVLGKTLSLTGNPSLHFDKQLAVPPNTAPVVNAGGNQTITLPAAATLSGGATDDGLPNPPGALSYKWTQSSGPVQALIASPAQPSTAVSFTLDGTYVFQLTASDGVLSSSALVQVTVNPRPNQAPAVSAGADQTITLPTTATLNGSATDDGLPNPPGALTYQWSQVSGPGAASIANPAQASTAVTFPSAGAYVFRLTASDGALTGSATVQVTVNPAVNHAPVVSAGTSQTIALPATATLDGSATDDGLPTPPGALAYQWSQLSGPAQASIASPAQSSTTVSFTTDGTYVFQLTASDGELSSSATAQVIVNPRLNQGPAVGDDFYETSLGQTLFVQSPGVLANDADPNGGALTAAKLTNPDKGTVSSFSRDGSFTYVAPPAPAGPALDVTRTLEIEGGSHYPISPLLSADVDGDGKPDVITVEYNGPDGDVHVYRGATGEQLFHYDALPPAQVGGLPCEAYGEGIQTFAAADIDDDGQVEIVSGTNCTGDPNNPGGYTRVVAVAYDPSQPEHFRVKWLSAPLVNNSHTIGRVPMDSSYTVARLSPNEKPSVLLGGTLDGNQNCAQVLASSTDSACRVVWSLNGADGSLKRVYYAAPTDQSFISGAYHSGNVPAAGGGFMAPVVADVDNDGAPDILYEGTLWNADGTLKRQFDGNQPNTATQSSAVADLDGDAQMEIVTLDDAYVNGGSAGAGLLQAWKADGRRLWQLPVPRTTVETKLSIADVDRDGGPEIIFGDFDTVWVVDQSGHIKWLRNMKGLGDNNEFQFSQGTGYPASFAVYDLNGDGTPEMVVQYGGNALRFLRADTGEDEAFWSYPGQPAWDHGGSPQTPLVADIDGSGHASVLFLHHPITFCNCETLVQVLRGDTVQWQAAPTHYNQQAYWESNFNADGTVPTTYAQQTADPRTNVFAQQPQAPYAPGFVPATETSFTYSATNAAALSNTAKVNIHISPQNRPPRFTSKPPTAFVPGNNVDYQAHAADPDLGDTITYGLAFSYGSNAVASVDPGTGLVRLSQLNSGDQSFIISATDNHGAASYQPFILHQTAGFANVPNVVGMTQADASSSLTSAHLLVGGVTQQYASSPAGTVIGQSPAAGTTLPQGESVDLTLSLGPVPVVVPPVASIDSPADGSRITTPTNFVGTVSGSWRLEYALNGGTQGQVWASIASGNTPVTNGTLGTVDPTLLLNGSYTFRLIATNAAGQRSVSSFAAVVDGDLKVGLFSIGFTDLDVPVAGLPIQVQRTYDSRDKRTGDFGVGWSLGLRNARLEKSGELGEDWEETSTGGSFPTYCLFSRRPKIVTVTFPSNDVYVFQMSVKPQCQSLVPIESGRVEYKELPGPADLMGATLIPLGGDEGVFYGGSAPGTGDLIGDSSVALYNPTRFQLTTADGTDYVIDEKAGLQSIRDTNGNTLTISDAGVVHSGGQSIAFTRDAQHRITRITDPAGHSLDYTYDANGDLASATDRDGRTTRFTYNSSHGLLDITDPMNRRGIRNEYDDAGRLVSVTDEEGKTIRFQFDPNSRQQVITDRKGARTVYEFDGRGNTISITDAEGRVTRATYDEAGNRLTQTDQLGNTTAFTYDARGNLLSKTDAQNRTTRYSYNGRNQMTSMTDANGNTTVNAYNDNGNLTSTTDAAGNATTFTYNSAGLMLTRTDAAGHASSFEYDASGNMTKETDRDGGVTRYGYDELGNRTSVTDPRGNTTQFTYDDSGLLTATLDALGNTTRREYDAAGNLSVSVDALGRRQAFSSNFRGMPLQTTNPDGTQLSLRYDANGLLAGSSMTGGPSPSVERNGVSLPTKLTVAPGAAYAYQYDAAGRASATTDPVGNTTTYEYNLLNRVTSKTDALGNRVRYDYDAVGNLVGATDAGGNTLAYAYDKANRRVRSTLPDGGSYEDTYDPLGRVTARRDATGNVTTFTYDNEGRLLSAAQPGGGVTRYAYDPNGNLISSTDAEGRKTLYEYDKLNRLVRRTFPDATTELSAYDASGAVASTTDRKGNVTAFEYDDAGRLARVRYADGNAVAYTYTPTGLRDTVTDARGVTDFDYDEQERLTRVRYPSGTTVGYAYDAAGNRTAITTPDGTTSYGYDKANRLVKVTDPRGLVTSYAYDASGNVTRINHPNGLTTSRTYDRAGRLLSVRTARPNGEVVFQETYTRDAGGRRTGVTQTDGSTVAYSYDAQSRLTGETYMDAGGGLLRQVSYTYDAVGNRLTTTEGGATVSCAYNANDQLTSDGAGAYAYDANGNNVSEDRGGFVTRYDYDARDRLTRATRPDGSVLSYGYDADGNRVRAAGPGGAVSNYVVDLAGGAPQVLVETDDGGNVVASYTYGIGLISQRRDGHDSFYIHDALGSTRALTDASGAVTDSYSYDAFGRLTASAGATVNPFLYTGEQLDAATGLYYLRSRYYNPAAGRFTTADSYDGELTDPPTQHKYVYVRNNPVNLTDPTGMYGVDEGNSAHQEIGRFYIELYGDYFVDFLGYEPNKGFGVMTLPMGDGLGAYNRAVRSGQKVGQRPDLRHYGDGDVYEIKPMTLTGLLAAMIEVRDYIQDLNQRERRRWGPWRLGRESFWPVVSLYSPELGTFEAYAFPNAPVGTVLYTNNLQRDLDNLSAAASAVSLARRSLLGVRMLLKLAPQALEAAAKTEVLMFPPRLAAAEEIDRRIPA